MKTVYQIQYQSVGSGVVTLADKYKTREEAEKVAEKLNYNTEVVENES